MCRLHPDWNTTTVGRESQRVISDAKKFGRQIRDDLDRGVSESRVLAHLPDKMREAFGTGMREEARRGDAIGKFRQESGAQGMVAEDGSLSEEGQTRIMNASLAALLGRCGNAALLQKIMSNAGRLDMTARPRRPCHTDCHRVVTLPIFPPPKSCKSC